ncbi:hypothetical protein [Jeotgalibacillus soli]|uniref:Uncharacterized protein n=1 Tax=Jeotgalibacillus soli TaxID=889306 RepID=A0A0C2R656_9BACL|nr:hypothetical protein [Jeotgalibacillus soli]KIL45740.1 hypothetical protein KP78_20890 [Jeotgalibacillus soli]
MITKDSALHFGHLSLEVGSNSENDATMITVTEYEEVSPKHYNESNKYEFYLVDEETEMFIKALQERIRLND